MGNDFGHPLDYSNKVRDIKGYTNVYKKGGINNVPMGQGSMSMGVKILQDMKKGEMYVTTNSGKKYVTKNGTLLPDASEIIKSGLNYGRGPAVMISGDPEFPQYSMWSASNTTAGGYEKIVINNKEDLDYAVKRLRKQTGPIESSEYGFAAVNPFLAAPRDLWSGVADFNRSSDKIGEQLLMPVVGSVADEFIPGIGLLLESTGVNKAITNAITQSSENRRKSKIHQSGRNLSYELSSQITDPRLEPAMRSAMLWSMHNAPGKYAKRLASAQTTGSDMRHKLMKMRFVNRHELAHNQSHELGENLARFEKIIPDFNYKGIRKQLNSTMPPKERLALVSKINRQIKSSLLPKMQKLQESALQAEQSPVGLDESIDQPTHSSPSPDDSNIINGDSELKLDNDKNIV